MPFPRTFRVACCHATVAFKAENLPLSFINKTAFVRIGFQLIGKVEVNAPGGLE